jgi:Holliday junction DNA helicase RuvA
VITSLAGTVAALGPDVAVLEVGGVGLAVQCTPATLAGLRPGQPARLATSLVVREDSLTLYGFADDDERRLFELLQSAGGVGPRLAQAVLAAFSPAAVVAAVTSEDVTALTRIPGIGRKGAQRIVLDLKDKIAGMPVAGTGSVGAPPPAREPVWREQLRSALHGLGWTGREIDDGLAAAGPQAEAAAALGEEPDIADLLRSALRSMSRV